MNRTAWYIYPFGRHPFLYSNGKMTDLLTGSITPYGQADAINNNGQIVGWVSNFPSSSFNAFIYQNGKLTDLNTLIDPASGWHLQEATDINDNGQIVGYGTDPQGATHAFLVSPIPEPSSAVMFAIGCAALTLRRPQGTANRFLRAHSAG